MKTANLIRWGALAALASGVLWIAGPPPPGLPARSSRRAWLLPQLPRHRRVQRRLPGHARGAGRTSCPSDGGLRTAWNGGLLPRLHRSSAGVRWPGAVSHLSAQWHARMAIQRPRLRFHGWHPPNEPRIGALEHRHHAGTSTTLLVRVRARRVGGLLGCRSVRGVRAGRLYLAGARIRAAADKGQNSSQQSACMRTTLSDRTELPKAG